MKANIVIIGTGPAGAMAACHLADKGIKVIILEKAELPRFKACGGLIPESAINKLCPFISSSIENSVTQRVFSYSFNNIYESHTPKSPLLLVDRARFDAELIEHALTTGKGNLSLKEKFTVVDVIETNDNVMIYGQKGEPIQADFVIAADGATSKTAHCLGLNSGRVNAIGMDVELKVSQTCFQQYSEQVIFDYYCLPSGYGWIFPKAEGILSAGVASWGKGIDLKTSMTDYLANRLSPGSIIKSDTHAHPIPVYTGQSSIASPRVCLVGDAASLVDPVTGEGIRFALQSGLIAAVSICEIINNGSIADSQQITCQLYQDRISASTGKWLDGLHRFASLAFLQAPEYYYRQYIVGTNGEVYQ